MFVPISLILDTLLGRKRGHTIYSNLLIYIKYFLKTLQVLCDITEWITPQEQEIG